jgi:hypothetical protein
MQCLRCEGLMIGVRMDEPWSAGEARGWRCLLCGETTDSVVEANRLNPHPHLPARNARVPGSPAASSKRQK